MMTDEEANGTEVGRKSDPGMVILYDDGRSFVRTDVIMNPLIPFIDGLTVSIINDRPYLSEEVACKWLEDEGRGDDAVKIAEQLVEVRRRYGSRSEST